MKSAFAVLLVLACYVFGTSASAADHPNIVLFLVDDMGWIDSAPYGSQYYETPNIQRLAKQSMRFTDAYALPLCSPTRSSILSGQYAYAVTPDNCNFYNRDGLPTSPFCSQPDLLVYDPNLPK